MSRWQRPPGPISVWKVVDGYEKLEDGTQKPVKFSIQEIPLTAERRKEALDLMCTHFLVEEPLSKATRIKQDPDGVQGFRTVWEYGLDQGVGIGCYQLDADGKIGKLIGANILFVMTDGTAEDFAKLKKEFKSKNFKKIWAFFEKLAHNVDVREMYKVDIYLSSISLSVLPAYRGQKIGYYILNARSDMGKKYGFGATSTMFTAAASQKQAERAGFEVGCSMDYVDAVDDEGNQLFPDIDQKCAKIMTKRLP